MSDIRNFEEYRRQVLESLGEDYTVEDLRNEGKWRARVLDALGVDYDTSDTSYFERYRLKVLEGLQGGGGGGGLEIEEGVYTPTEDVARPSIRFANTHSEAPILVMMSDASGTHSAVADSNLAFTFSSYYGYTGQAVPSNESSSKRYALVSYVYFSTSPSQAVNAITALTGSGKSSIEYWVSATEFFPSSASDSRYWRTGRTYKWIVIWKPNV